MKLLVAPVAFLLAVVSVQAGGFGGPRPFTDQSPLTTGVDGAYTAIAKGTNLSGVIRWNYSNNRQTTGTPSLLVGNVFSDVYNEYVIFVNGLAYRGLDQTAINGPQISGVLDNGGANVPNMSSTGSGAGSTSLLSFMSGYFNGRADLNSPEFYFKGDGHVQVYDVTAAVPPATTGTFSPVSEQSFTFSGVRNSSSIVSESATP